MAFINHLELGLVGWFSLVTKKCGYSQSNGDHSLFCRHTKIKKITILIVYVDNIIITGNDPGNEIFYRN